MDKQWLLLIPGIPLISVVVFRLIVYRVINLKKVDSEELERLRAFIGPNSKYYAKKYFRFKKSGKLRYKLSLNFAAGFWGGWWFCYRRMYLFSVAAFLLQAIQSYGFWLMIGEGIKSMEIFFVGLILFLMNSSILAIVSDFVYCWHCHRRISKIVQMNPSNPLEILAKEGGVIRELIYLAWMIIVVGSLVSYTLFIDSETGKMFIYSHF